MTAAQPALPANSVTSGETPPAALFAASLDAHTRRLPPEFYTVMNPERVGTAPRLIHASAPAAALLDMTPTAFRHPAFASVFAGHHRIGNFEPLATVYSGHQFGTYVPRLGDGRALLIAEVRNRARELWGIQLKGAGHTPYSRSGDGRAVMRSSLREYLCSEHMAALGIPTTRALSVVATGETVYRETPEPGAIVTRLAPSFVRFGHFEYFHHAGRPDLVRVLADHVIAEHFSGLARSEERFALWFREIVQRTAHLLAAWQAFGFAHGVMNTDNMSILGLTIDYGPFGFLDGFDPHFICNHSDHTGRYAFDQQPGIALWNLQALAVALSTLIETDTLKEALSGFAAAFIERFTALMHRKLGFADFTPQTADMAEELLQIMMHSASDYTLTFRLLSRAGTPEGREAWLALFSLGQRPEAAAWLERYGLAPLLPASDRRVSMDAINPKYVLRNWIAETVIRAVEDRHDLTVLERVMRVLQTPFDEHPGDAEFAAPPPEPLRHLSVSCSS
ncbi:MAG: YdiU family protein [Rhodospirillaceae bacterium]|nr:YdiU family protein [Rhodospirillaceae bacterium]